MANILIGLITGFCVIIGGIFGFNYGYSKAVNETVPVVVERTQVIYEPCVQLAGR